MADHEDPAPPGDPNGESDRSKLPSLSRGELAAFLKSRAMRVRDVARRKLLSRTRRIYDSEDVLSSTIRRMDEMALEGMLRPHNEEELWTLTRTIAQNNAVSKNRMVSRLDRLLQEEGVAFAMVADFIQRRAESEKLEDVLARLAAVLENSTDRQYFFLRMRGATHRAASDALGITHDAGRQRWVGIMARLRAAAAGELNGA